jgi:ketosteroid isomerase-like protein
MNSLEIVDRAYTYLNKKDLPNYFCNLAHIWTVEAEKIVRLEVYIDTDVMNAALTTA